MTAEIARVLKPGGLFVFLDSLQMGDKPGWDGLLEGFPHRFHEPYYRHYAPTISTACSGRRPGRRHDHDAVPVEADGAAEALRSSPIARRLPSGMPCGVARMRSESYDPNGYSTNSTIMPSGPRQ